MKETTRAHLAVLGTNLFFAANFSLVKMIAPVYIGPYGLNIVRAGGSALLFWMLWATSRGPAGFERKDTGRFLLCALFGVALNQMLFLKGLTLTSTVHASLLMLITPLVVTLFAAIVLKERFTTNKAIGLSLGIGGALFLILQKEGGQEGSNYLLGDGLIILNAVFYSFYFILVKPLMARYSAVHVIRWIFTIGTLFILPFGWEQLNETRWEQWPWQQAAALIAVVFFGTFLAYLFNAYGIKHIGAGATGAYIYTQPLFAVAIAVAFAGEVFSLQKGFAALLIFCGVFLANLKRKN